MLGQRRLRPLLNTILLLSPAQDVSNRGQMLNKSQAAGLIPAGHYNRIRRAIPDYSKILKILFTANQQ
jgi:hypothetical protein